MGKQTDSLASSRSRELARRASTHKSPRRLQNGEFHSWYQFVWGYSDHLVSGLLEEFALTPSARVLDPFCGTGTTLVESLKKGYDCVGIDASPASVFVSRVKTRWNLPHATLVRALDTTIRTFRDLPRGISSYQDDLTFAYLEGSGMLSRRWIAPEPLCAALAIKHAIYSLDMPSHYRDLLMLALLDAVVHDGSNVRFGPELYVHYDARDADMLDSFASRVLQMAMDLALAPKSCAKATIVRGDSREIRKVARRTGSGKFDAVICSPPYPAEHDYTRNARLELAFLEATLGPSDVQAIKRTMIRSHTKGVYSDDRDWMLVWCNPKIASIAAQIDSAVATRKHGFARLYSTVVVSYFGGMYRHFRSVRNVLKSGARLAYVVSDQASYANIPIPTASILSELAEWAGLKPLEIRHWRSRQSSATARVIDEEILFLERAE